MREFAGRVAVVTGGASGIGRALAGAWLAEGMKVVIADNSQARIDETLDHFGRSADLIGVATDVSRGEDLERLAARTLDTFGAAHVLCSNAGVGGEHGATWEQSVASWEWVLGVNLWGAIHAIRAFVPHMIAQGEPGHVVCTSSLAGLRAMPYTSGYSASKYAVVSVCETLHQELAGIGVPIGVSVVSPGPARTPILDPTRERPPGVAGPASGGAADAEQEAATRAVIDRIGYEPEEVAERIVSGIRNDQFWIFTHEGSIEWVDERHQRMLRSLPPSMATLDSLPARPGKPA